jgi:hypothetical protein
MRFTPRELTLALAFLQLTQALRVTDSGTRRRFEPMPLLSDWAFFASELADSEDWAGVLVEEGRILRKDIVKKVFPRHMDVKERVAEHTRSHWSFCDVEVRRRNCVER